MTSAAQQIAEADERTPADGGVIAECRNLTKRYGSLAALDNVNLRLESGKMYGLLGRNGAGKTTLLHLLTGQILPSSGDVRVYGRPVFENSPVLQKICFIKESQEYPKTMRVADVLRFASMLYPNWDAALADQMIRRFRLDVRKKTGQLSRGMESMLGIVIGLASRADLTIFDEPYLGLDAANRTLFYDVLLQDFAERPRTIILSTHLIEEVNRLFDEVIILKHGRIVLHDDMETLRAQTLAVSGGKAKVEQWIRGKRVLHRHVFGDTMTAAIYGQIGDKERKALELEGLRIEPLPLQQFMVRFTADEEGVADE